ncbi:hypothetical protein CDD81_5884 [Ophiocordyceps australis]|uniref:Uncharacterized protein n=1 Tax=Ophiocordyceps australis TaxID=1399860 RepID=A0A2C5YHI2_9HYPO|nr:hypothetical protein CDD81_5884 [Ophiocordyceps australis]
MEAKAKQDVTWKTRRLDKILRYLGARNRIHAGDGLAPERPVGAGAAPRAGPSGQKPAEMPTSYYKHLEAAVADVNANLRAQTGAKPKYNAFCALKPTLSQAIHSTGAAANSAIAYTSPLLPLDTIKPAPLVQSGSCQALLAFALQPFKGTPSKVFVNPTPITCQCPTLQIDEINHGHSMLLVWSIKRK